MNYLKLKNLKRLKLCLAVTALIALTSCASAPSVDYGLKPVKNDSYSGDVFRVSEIAEKAYRESRWSDAARHYQNLTEKVPGDAYIWFRLANTYAQKGEFDQAIHAYEQSIERDSMQPKPWFNLSTAYLLNAKVALMQSWEKLRAGDPARDIIMRRIGSIDHLMNQEMGELKVSNQ